MVVQVVMAQVVVVQVVVVQVVDGGRGPGSRFQRRWRINQRW